jgi:hypothetical protein
MSLSWGNIHFVAQIDFDFNTVNSVEPNLRKTNELTILGIQPLRLSARSDHNK